MAQSLVVLRQTGFRAAGNDQRVGMLHRNSIASSSLTGQQKIRPPCSIRIGTDARPAKLDRHLA